MGEWNPLPNAYSYSQAKSREIGRLNAELNSLRTQLAEAQRADAAKEKMLSDLRAHLEHVGNRATQAERERDAARDAVENILIAYGMNWDMDGVVDAARAALQGSKPE